jgi:ribose transport system permease protein
VFLLGLVVFFSLTADGFLSLTNFQAVAANMTLLVVMAIGQTFVIITAGIDLSTGFVMGLASVVAALFMRRVIPDMPLGVIIIGGFAAATITGLAAGAVNGVVVSRLSVPPFIATLGMLGIAQGLAFILSGGPPVSVPVPGLGDLGNNFVVYYHPDAGISLLQPPAGLEGQAIRQTQGYLPLMVVYLVAILAASHWLLSRTGFGQHIYAIGGNKRAALRAGIPVGRNLVTAYMLSAGLAGVAGFLYLTRYTGGAASGGEALLLQSIAAIVIGGASLMGGAGTIIGTFIGALIIAVIQNGMVILGIDPFWQYVAVGVVIIVAVLVDQAKSRLAT